MDQYITFKVVSRHYIAGRGYVTVVHNPLLICALSKNPDVNFIEMTRGYVNKVKKLVKELV